MFTKLVSSPISATVALALFNSSSVIGQVLIGHLTDKVPYPYVMFITATLGTVSAFLLWGFATKVAQIFAFAILFGGLVSGVLVNLPLYNFSLTTDNIGHSRWEGSPLFGGLP